MVNGEVHFSSLNAVRGRGGHPGLALGVAPGALRHIEGTVLHARCFEDIRHNGIKPNE